MQRIGLVTVHQLQTDCSVAEVDHLEVGHKNYPVADEDSGHHGHHHRYCRLEIGLNQIADLEVRNLSAVAHRYQTCLQRPQMLDFLIFQKYLRSARERHTPNSEY